MSVTLAMNKYGDGEIEKIAHDPLNPTTLSFLNADSNIITIPVWIYYSNGNFFIFTDEGSKKVQAITEGRDQLSICIINKSQFPNPQPGSIPYISIIGVASIVTTDEIPNLDQIYLDLLKKYDPEYKEYWIKTVVEKIRADPFHVWMVRVIPTKII